MQGPLAASPANRGHAIAFDFHPAASLASLCETPRIRKQRLPQTANKKKKRKNSYSARSGSQDRRYRLSFLTKQKGRTRPSREPFFWMIFPCCPVDRVDCCRPRCAEWSRGQHLGGCFLPQPRRRIMTTGSSRCRRCRRCRTRPTTTRRRREGETASLGD